VIKMKLAKEARKVIVDQFENSPKKNKEDLIEMIRPHYIPDYRKLVEQDLGRLANQIAASVRDENGARRIFAINDDGKQALVNVDKSEDIQDLRAVYKDLLKGRDSRERSIGKVFKRGQEVAGQMALEFDSPTG
jgi:hypothetical protein